MLLDILSMPSSRRDWAVLISALSLVIAAAVLAFGNLGTPSIVAAGLSTAAIATSIISALIRRSVGIPLCVVSGILPIAGIAALVTL